MQIIYLPFNSLAELIKSIGQRHKNINRFKDKINKYKRNNIVVKALELRLNKKKQKIEPFKQMKYHKDQKRNIK